MMNISRNGMSDFESVEGKRMIDKCRIKCATRADGKHKESSGCWRSHWRYQWCHVAPGGASGSKQPKLTSASSRHRVVDRPKERMPLQTCPTLDCIGCALRRPFGSVSSILSCFHVRRRCNRTDCRVEMRADFCEYLCVRPSASVFHSFLLLAVL